MSLVVGVDLGTTSITALAVDVASGSVAARRSRPTPAPRASAAGRAEWEPAELAAAGFDCLRELAETLGDDCRLLNGLGITGQQHGGLLLDGSHRPLTPFINWQDRRGEQAAPGDSATYVELARRRLGDDVRQRTGCRLAGGYLGTTLFWLREKGLLPAGARACFLMDYFGACLTDQPPVTDSTCAASSGLFDIQGGQWDQPACAALGLSPALFPPIRASGEVQGKLSAQAAAATGLPAGLPVGVGIGDHQASFVGSVADAADTVFLNVGTGAQVAVYSERLQVTAEVEARPFPRGGGQLLVAAGLSGGAAYAALERFVRLVGSEVFGITAREPLYPILNRLAAQAPAGADGLRCEPLFAGTRAQPERRAAWTGMSAGNFTPAHLTRALLEGMADTYRAGHDTLAHLAGRRWTRLVGAGNGLRENLLLARIVAQTFGLPLQFPRHREEAAFGAALVAAVGIGLIPDLAEAGRLIRYGEPGRDREPRSEPRP